MSPDGLVLNRKPTSGWNMPRVADLKNKTKNLDALHQWKLESDSHWNCACTHTHTSGFAVQVKGLIRDERRPHIAPCKGPLSPFLLQCSVKLWETNDLRATALCATAKEKEGGRGSSFVGGRAPSLSRLPNTSPPCHPCAQHRGVSHASSSCCSSVSNKSAISAERARHPSPSAQGAFPLACLAGYLSLMVEGVLLLLICTFSYH